MSGPLSRAADLMEARQASAFVQEVLSPEYQQRLSDMLEECYRRWPEASRQSLLSRRPVRLLSIDSAHADPVPFWRERMQARAEVLVAVDAARRARGAADRHARS